METGIRTELEKYGFATIDYSSNLTRLVADAMESWKKFCKLPLDIKSRFTYTNDYATGYEFKDEIGETKDQKENFHFILDDLPRLFKIAKQNNIDGSFVSRAETLLNGIEDSICGFAGLLEREFNIKGLRDEVYLSKGHWLLRYLHYFSGSTYGKVIAFHHCDKVGLTMYLGETTHGVEYYSQNHKWLTMPVLSGQTIITPDLQIQYKTHGELKALYHRVVANEKAAKEGRYSIVCFIPFVKTSFTNKERIGRMQDMPLAFNYDMPFERFSKLFD